MAARTLHRDDHGIETRLAKQLLNPFESIRSFHGVLAEIDRANFKRFQPRFQRAIEAQLRLPVAGGSYENRSRFRLARKLESSGFVRARSLRGVVYARPKNRLPGSTIGYRSREQHGSRSLVLGVGLGGQQAVYRQRGGQHDNRDGRRQGHPGSGEELEAPLPVINFNGQLRVFDRGGWGRGGWGARLLQARSGLIGTGHVLEQLRVDEIGR